jgi:hypothetical protein
MAGCTASNDHQGSRDAAEVHVEAGSAATLHVPGGAEVDLPAGGVGGNGTLSGRVITTPAPAPAGFVIAGDVYDLHVTGTSLTGAATIRLPVPAQPAVRGLAAPTAAVMAYYDTMAAKWVTVDSSYDAATRTLTARVESPVVQQRPSWLCP